MHLHEAMLVRMAFRLPSPEPSYPQSRRRDPLGRARRGRDSLHVPVRGTERATGAHPGAHPRRPRVRALDGRRGADPHVRGRRCRAGRARRRRGLDTRPAPDPALGGNRPARLRLRDERRRHVGLRAHGRPGLRRCRVVDSRRVRCRSGGGVEQRCRSGPGRRLDARRSALGLGCRHARDRPRRRHQLAARVRGAGGRRGGGRCRPAPGARGRRTAVGCRAPRCPGRRSAPRLGDQ